MKKILFCLGILSFMFLGLNSQVNAQEVAIINLEEIIKNSNAMNKFTKSLESQKKDMEKKLKAEEDVLTKERTGLESELTHLSNSLAQEKAMAFQRKVFDFQNKVKDNESVLQKKYMNAVVEVTNNIRTILTEMKSEKNTQYTFSVVLPKSSTLFNDNSVDISAEVLSRLNKKLKTITASDR